MRKLFMNLGSTAQGQQHAMARTAFQPQPSTTNASATQQRAVGKSQAIQKMMNVYSPKVGGGCSSCGSK